MFQFIKDLFQKQEEHNVPIIQEMLKRTAKEEQAYQYWLNDINERGASKLQTRLKEQYTQNQTNQNNRSLAVFMKNPKSNGFVMFKTEQEENKEFVFFFDYLKDICVNAGYRVYMSDVKNYARKEKNHTEKIERHYLKPKIDRQNKTSKANQLYGNISIELTFHNETVQNLKFICNAYQDKLFTTALNFDELLNLLINS